MQTDMISYRCSNFYIFYKMYLIMHSLLELALGFAHIDSPAATSHKETLARKRQDITEVHSLLRYTALCMCTQPNLQCIFPYLRKRGAKKITVKRIHLHSPIC